MDWQDSAMNTIMLKNGRNVKQYVNPSQMDTIYILFRFDAETGRVYSSIV